MPQFDYQQLCHFVLPEQGGLSVETILKRFLHLTPREIRHAKYIPDGIQKNGVSCRTNAVVQTGDTITFRYAQKCPHLSEDQVLPVSGDSAGVRILYEDSDLCVADKPSGMVCHASHGHYSDSLTHAAASLLKTPTAPSELRCIGRLDKDTSGLVLFAKNQLAAARLSRQRESGALKKEYLALVHHPFSEETQKETIRLSMEQIPGDDPDSFDPSGKRITKMRICKEGNGPVGYYTLRGCPSGSFLGRRVLPSGNRPHASDPSSHGIYWTSTFRRSALRSPRRRYPCRAPCLETALSAADDRRTN